MNLYKKVPIKLGYQVLGNRELFVLYTFGDKYGYINITNLKKKLNISIKKRWRMDINMWETSFSILEKGVYFRYTLHGSKSKFKLFAPIKGAKYFKFTPTQLLPISDKEIEEEYNGNKWTVPVNYKIKLEKS